MSRFVQLLKIRQVPIKTRPKEKTMHKFAATLHENDNYNISVAIISERFRIQFNAEIPVSNITLEGSTHRIEVDSRATETHTSTSN